MAFHSGRVSFCRFRVEGDAPDTVDDTMLGILAEHAFREQDIGEPQEIESGWTTGVHLFDGEFSYEKNGYGDMLLCALRIDTHKVPADIKQAYQRMNEAASKAQTDNPTGFLSRREKREAQESAARQLRDDLAAGKFRKSKAVPVLWDLREKLIYFGGSGNTPAEQLMSRMRDSFNVDLQPITSGSFAGDWMKTQGRQRDYEDLKPTAFTDPPADVGSGSGGGGSEDDDAGPIDRTTPAVPWTASSLDMKDFIGNEMLLWLWWHIETHEGVIPAPSASGGKADEIAVVISKALDMDCAWDITGKQTLRGDNVTRMPEAGEALGIGKWPRKAGLILADTGDSQQWELTLQADKFMVSSAQLPQVDDVTSMRELIEYRLQSIRRLGQIIDSLMGVFLEQRTSGKWQSRRDAIRKWIRSRRPRQAITPAAPSAVGVQS